MATWKQVRIVIHEIQLSAALTLHGTVSSGLRVCNAALQDTLGTVRPSVQSGLEPESEAGWTAQQYAAAVRAITAGPPHAVLASELVAQFGGRSSGRQVLEMMVREDLVFCRPYSEWARDLPEEAFRASDGPVHRLEVVVTAPTAAHLYCMRELTLPYPTPPVASVGH